MGTISHNAMVITTYGEDYESDPTSESRYARALEAFAREHGIKLLGPFDSEMNGYVTYLLPPDGSKEGWPTSREGDERRKKLVDFLKVDADAAYDWVDVRYGELGCAVENSGDD